VVLQILKGDTDLSVILAKNQTEPENAAPLSLHFQRLAGVENGGASCRAGSAE
jgi:hypothetical protein